MSGDYSRLTYDPVKRYSGVLMQQGRVQLDSDWNEEIDILRRRIRTLSTDALGLIGVPYLSLPDSFLLGLIGGPPADDLSIEPGRLYLHGLVAEAFEEDYATYNNQPFYPDPPPLPNGDSVAYLDIWDREVTYIEDPDLLDAALGGADTTTRCQTVWQLKVDAVEDAECGLPVGEEPSAGRLTTDAVAPTVPNDPCPLPPIAGYRGLENRLYRIEVHEGGPLGTATFKWSRDNASIVSAVTEISVAGAQATLTVNRIGRDEVLRFRINDWVEVTDDHRELMGEPGEMARIFDIDDANRKIILETDVTANGRPFGNDSTQLAERHTRIKRWDQTATTNSIDANGLITVDAGPIEIEDGIEISFSADPVGGNFRIGDYWTFWARTATASIEVLTDAPPRGIEHHYVQLGAIANFGDDNADIDDCRPPQTDGEGCCTVIVHPGENIQAAIDSLPDEGGCVCLKAGTHDITSTIQIRRSLISIHGESPGTIVRSVQAAPVLQIGPDAANIRVCSVQFEAVNSDKPPQAVILIAGAVDVAIEDCQVRAEIPTSFVGIRILRSDDVSIERCVIESVQVGIWAADFCRMLSIKNNEVKLSQGLRDGLEQFTLGGSGVACILVQNSPSPCHIEENILTGAFYGIVLNDNITTDGPPQSLSAGSQILGNFVIGAKSIPSQDGDDRISIIDVASDFTTISNNRVFYFFQANNGIKVTGSRCQILANMVISNVADDNPSGPIGIQVGDTIDGQNVEVMGAVVNDNVAYGFQHGIIITGIEDITIHSNLISADSVSQNFGIGLNRVLNGSVKDNRIRFMFSGIYTIRGRLNRFSGNSLSETGGGISLLQEWTPAVTENRIDRASNFGAVGSQLFGRCDFIANRITSAGYDNNFAIGIGVALHAGELHIESNEIIDTGLIADQDEISTRSIGIFGEFIMEARVESNLVTYTNAFTRDPEREDRALRMRGLAEAAINDNLTLGFPIQIISNKFIGTGRSALVELAQASQNFGNTTLFIRFERVSFDHNYCMHVASENVGGETGANFTGATVSLVGRHGIVMGNHIKATNRSISSVNFNGMPGPFIGNVTTSGSSQHPQFPAPENNFNMLA
ncbi:MAG: hypothetical protein G3M70_11150 [Candidatus Nitronauta litoralis]|uniref:Right handed beta helix domain-containing protein n=1 Tax=Candidatus Nitronauta litoralis TaxID=2705533 RepID=A0A7T0BWU2_9BACT|nr:MAG: hypothetical protein G3M70_11150 [Candidatus Nitronauta litoralis]